MGALSTSRIDTHLTGAPCPHPLLCLVQELAMQSIEVPASPRTVMGTKGGVPSRAQESFSNATNMCSGSGSCSDVKSVSGNKYTLKDFQLE